MLAEIGFLIGFVLPGDSLLVTAGVLAATQVVSLQMPTLIVLLVPAAIIGDTVGYGIGLRVGPRLFARPDSRFFRRTHMVPTQASYERHGGKTIMLARFVPIVRTLAPVVAVSRACRIAASPPILSWVAPDGSWPCWAAAISWAV